MSNKMRDKRSTLVLFSIIALQVIIAVAVFAGASGKKPKEPAVEVIEEVKKEEVQKEEPPQQEEVKQEEVVENTQQTVQEPQETYPQENVVVEENPQGQIPLEQIPQDQIPTGTQQQPSAQHR